MNKKERVKRVFAALLSLFTLQFYLFTKKFKLST